MFALRVRDEEFVGGTLQPMLYLGSEGTSDANNFLFLSTWISSTLNTYWYYYPRSHYLPESNLPVSTCVLSKIKGDRLAWIYRQLLLVTRHKRFSALNVSMTFSSMNYYLQFKWRYSRTAFAKSPIFLRIFWSKNGCDRPIVIHEMQTIGLNTAF